MRRKPQTITLTRKTALELNSIIRHFERTGDWRAEPQRAVDELRAALATPSRPEDGTK